MNAPIVWIISPLIIATLAFFFRRWKITVSVLVSIFVLLLALFALWFPIGEKIQVGPLSFTISDQISFLGRQLLLNNVDRPLLSAIYITLAFFFLGTLLTRVSKVFVPIGLAMSSLLVASLAVKPFLYAALFIQVAVLVSTPLLSPPGKKVEPGVLRYLVLMTSSLPFMLMGSWMLSIVDPNVTDLSLFYPVLISFGLGFAFLLAIFPLNSWIPMLGERIHPFSVAFLLSVFPYVVIFLLLRFIGEFAWLLDSDIIQVLGLLMVITSGIWVAFQRDLGRILGYALIIEIGRTIMAISQPVDLQILVEMFLPRIFSFSIWALALSLMQNQVDSFRFRSVQGIGRQYPLLAFGVLTAQFSLAGFPLLAGFPVLLSLLNSVVQSSPFFAFLTLMGSFGLLASGLRSLAVFVMGPNTLPEKENRINRISQLFLVFGIIALFLLGLFPQWFLANLGNLVGSSFGQ